MRSRSLLAALAALATGIAGCPGPVRGDRIWNEDFETLCEGAPCGWVQIRGEPGQVRWIETIPGDHGLQLSGDGVAIRGPAGEPVGSPLADRIALRITARCDAGAILGVRVTIESSDRTTTTFSDEITADPEWGDPLPDRALSPIDGDPGPWRVSRVLSVTVLKNGEGVCEIDYLAIRAVVLIP